MRNFVLAIIGVIAPATTLAADGKHLINYGFDCKKIGLPIPGCGVSIDLVTAATEKVVATGLVIATPLATVVLLYGALRMVISRGEEGKEAGKKAMIYGAMGLVFVTLAYGLVKAVEAYLYLV